LAANRTLAAGVATTFFDVAVDRARQRVYASERSGSRVFVFSLPTMRPIAAIEVGPGPRGIDISPDGRQLAVAVSDAGQIALVDLQRLIVADRLIPDAGSPYLPSVPKAPYDVVYGRPGRLYWTGGPTSYGVRSGGLYAFDTVGKLESLPGPVGAAARLAITEDKNTLFVAEPDISPQQLKRFDVSTGIPRLTATAPHGPVRANSLVIRGDGSLVYASGGQVWTGDLSRLVGTFPNGYDLAYVPARDRLYVTSIAPARTAAGQPLLLEIDASDFSVVRSYAVDRRIDVVRADAEKGELYVGSDLGLMAIQLDAPASSSPTLLAAPVPSKLP
jgi:sugar lactone lactonase YvrE